jgi:hypothetical protein
MSKILEGDFDPAQGEIRKETFVWQLVNATLHDVDITPTIVQRDAAIYRYYTTSSRWMDTIELDPLIQLPADQSLKLTFKNVSNATHDCIVLVKCFTDQRVFYRKLPEGKAGPGSTFSSGICFDDTCTLVRLFMATERDLILRLPGVTLH